MYDFLKGLKQDDAYESLVTTFGDQAPPRATVFRWLVQLI